MKWSWFKFSLSGILISLFCIMQSGASIAARGEGLQVYLQNLQSPEGKQRLANDIERYKNADDIWDTMRSEFSLPHYEDNPRVQEMIRYWLNNQDELYLSASRAAPYLYYILEQARERHLPAEVALVPIVESDYNPNNTSSAGASGIWQLMPGTASGQGIKQNWWYDGRRDIVASTKAALNHLGYLGNFFDGNWLLAIAAYDTGEGNILKATRKNERLGASTDYWNLPVAYETKQYIPKLMALAVIISNPKKYNVKLPYVRNAPYLAEVDVGAQINLKQAAQLAGLTLQELQKLNPGFNRSATAPKGPYKLVLPIQNVEQFAANVQNVPQVQQDTYVHHTVGHGETFASLADKFNTSINALKKLNPRVNNQIKPGTNLIVPTTTTTLVAESQATPVEVAKSNTNPVKLQPGDTLYMVRKDDNLAKIAKHFHTSTNAIILANNLSKHPHLKTGSEITIPTGTIQAAVSSDSKYKLKPGDTIYMVRKKDTIETIAARYHTTPENLRVVNLLASNNVREGDRLVIPTHVS